MHIYHGMSRHTHTLNKQNVILKIEKNWKKAGNMVYLLPHKPYNLTLIHRFHHGRREPILQIFWLPHLYTHTHWSPGWSWTHRDPLASVSPVLELKPCSNMPGLINKIKSKTKKEFKEKCEWFKLLNSEMGRRHKKLRTIVKNLTVLYIDFSLLVWYMKEASTVTWNTRPRGSGCGSVGGVLD